ncbi:MAG: extracellular solute-binding protein [Bacilli bacterium]
MDNRNRCAFTTISTLVGSLAVFAAVGSALPTGAYAASKPPVTNIVFWAGHNSGQLHKALLAEVAQFDATHPSIHVKWLGEHATAQGIAAFLAHKAPNVAMIATNAAQTFINSGAILNLNAFVHSKEGLTPAQIHADYYPVVWQDMQALGGKAQYLMPLEKKSNVVLYYNEDLFRRAHIASAPKTWAQVVADADKITALGAAYHGIEWTPSVRQFFSMTMDFGGSVWSDPTHKTFDLNNTGARRALTILRDMVKNRVLVPTQGYNYQLNFGTGRVGMLIDASAGYTYDLGSVGGKFPMLAAPAPSGPVGRAYNYINGASLAMFKTGTSTQKSASWTFVKWMSSPATNTYWDEHTNYLPLGPAGMKMMNGFYRANPAYAASFSNPSYWVIKPKYASYSAAKTAMMSDFQKALLGQESVSQALANMTAQGNKYMTGQQRM